MLYRHGEERGGAGGRPARWRGEALPPGPGHNGSFPMRTNETREQHQRRHDILRPLLMAEAAKLSLSSIDVYYHGAEGKSAIDEITAYVNLGGPELTAIGLERGGPFNADDLHFKNLHELVEQFARCVLHLHFFTLDRGLGGFGTVIISPARGAVHLVKKVRYIAHRETREDV